MDELKDLAASKFEVNTERQVLTYNIRMGQSMLEEELFRQRLILINSSHSTNKTPLTKATLNILMTLKINQVITGSSIIFQTFLIII